MDVIADLWAMLLGLLWLVLVCIWHGGWILILLWLAYLAGTQMEYRQ